jgi:heme A synthase
MLLSVIVLVAVILIVICAVRKVKRQKLIQGIANNVHCNVYTRE